MLKIFIALVLFSSVLAGGGYHDVFKTYGISVVMKHCLKDAADDWYAQVHDALQCCYHQENLSPRQGNDAEVQVSWQEIFEKLSGRDSRSQPTFVPVYRLRNKRSHHQSDNPQYFDFNDITNLKTAMKAKLSNFTCVLEKLNVIDSKGDLMVEPMKDVYRRLTYLDSKLRDDLIEGIGSCADLVRCLPMKREVPGTTNLVKAYKFMKCERKNRMASCLRNDLRTMKNKFALEALDRDFDLMDDGEKMLHILAANEEVGPDTFDLFQ